jgi:hypothetical protein
VAEGERGHLCQMNARPIRTTEAYVQRQCST